MKPHPQTYLLDDIAKQCLLPTLIYLIFNNPSIYLGYNKNAGIVDIKCPKFPLLFFPQLNTSPLLFINNVISSPHIISIAFISNYKFK